MSNLNNNHLDESTLIKVDKKVKTKKPSLYQVLMLNDDYTPMDFVVTLLKRFFNKSHKEAFQIMLEVHKKGSSICGVYNYEIAETKTYQVINFSRENGHPLRCVLKKL